MSCWRQPGEGGREEEGQQEGRERERREGGRQLDEQLFLLPGLGMRRL